MKGKRKNSQIELRFDYFATFILWLGIESTLLASHMTIVTLFYLFFTVAVISWLVVLGFYRRYNWKNISVAVVLIISTIHPIRFIYYWQLSPIFYGMLTLICAICFIYIFRNYRWKNYIAVLMLFLTLSAAWQTVISVQEIGNCYEEDRRWNELYCCSGTHDCYQQIQHLPLGMSGWCYYCLWY